MSRKESRKIKYFFERYRICAGVSTENESSTLCQALCTQILTDNITKNKYILVSQYSSISSERRPGGVQGGGTLCYAAAEIAAAAAAAATPAAAATAATAAAAATAAGSIGPKRPPYNTNYRAAKRQRCPWPGCWCPPCSLINIIYREQGGLQK